MRRRGARADRLLATVMFTDIVGSTERAAALGDRRWKALVARHNATVRRLLRQYGGRELDTAGDGFFVMFERPAPAIDCAWAIVDALGALELEIRAAIHMGEVEVMGGKVGGIAVHVASRVLTLTPPGHIYVTGIVHDVVAGSDIRFVDQGVRELRGVPGEWRLFQVEQPAVDRAGPVDEPRDATARRRPTTAVLAALALGAALGTAALVLVLGSAAPAAPVAPGPNSVVQLQPDGRPVLTISISDPTGIAVADGVPWVISQGRRTVTRIDVQTGDAESIGLPATPTGIAAGDGAIWITTGFGDSSGQPGVLRLSASDPTVSAPIPLGDGADGVAAGNDAIWVTNRLDGTLSRIDPQTQSLTAEVHAGDQPVAVAAADGAVWVANASERTVRRIDPRSMSITAEVALAAEPHDLALGFGRLWVSSTLGASIYVVDADTTSLLQTVPLPGQARGVAAGTDAVWVALLNGMVARIDPAAVDDVQTFELAGSVEDVAFADGALWVSIRD